MPRGGMGGGHRFLAPLKKLPRPLRAVLLFDIPKMSSHGWGAPGILVGCPQEPQDDPENQAAPEKNLGLMSRIRQTPAFIGVGRASWRANRPRARCCWIGLAA